MNDGSSASRSRSAVTSCLDSSTSRSESSLMMQSFAMETSPREQLFERTVPLVEEAFRPLANRTIRENPRRDHPPLTRHPVLREEVNAHLVRLQGACLHG